MTETEMRIYKVTIDKSGLPEHKCPLGADPDVYKGLMDAFGPTAASRRDPFTGSPTTCEDYGDHCVVLIGVRDDYAVDTTPRGKITEIVLLDEETGPVWLSEHLRFLMEKSLGVHGGKKSETPDRILITPPTKVDFSNS